MNVSLTPELESLVNKKVKSGLYQTASEVVREALRVLKDRDEQLEGLRTDVLAGFAEIDRGDFLEFGERSTKRLAHQVHSRGRRALSQAKRIRRG
jgi:antitoxin ParD1/3/4